MKFKISCLCLFIGKSGQIKPSRGRLGTFTFKAIFFGRQQHTVGNLIALGLTVVQKVKLTTFGVNVLDRFKKALRKNMVYLRAISIKRRCVVKIQVPKIEEQVNSS